MHKKPSVTVDLVVFDNYLSSILLIQRAHDPFADHWALPGGFLNMDELIVHAAIRELYEETSIQLSPEQLNMVGVYDDIKRDPRDRVISVAFCGQINMEEYVPRANDDAADAKWFQLLNMPDELAFDHKGIIHDALMIMGR